MNDYLFYFQWIDHGYWYDKKDSSKLELLDVLLLTAMSPAESSGRSQSTGLHGGLHQESSFRDADPPQFASSEQYFPVASSSGVLCGVPTARAG